MMMQSETFDTVYDLAKRLNEHEDADAVEAREGRITVAHVPDDKFTEKIPDDLFHFILDTIEGTVYQWEYHEGPRPDLVEKHDLVGGVHHRAIAGERHELHVNLVK